MKFLKGLYKDSGILDQPQSTHRDALNMVMNLDKGSISTEYGNTVSQASAKIDSSIPKILGQDRKINGSILLPDNKFLLFYSTLYKTGDFSSSYIYLFDPEGDLMTLLFATSDNPNDAYYDINTGHLNFSPEYPITGEARVAANGDIIVYFTDNYKNVKVDGPTNIEYIDEYNPPRTFNITRQLANLKNGAPVNSLYLKVPGKKGTFTGKHVDYLNLFLTTKKIPEIKDHKLIKGGILETGAYYLCLAYATEDYTETNVYTVSQPVYIPKGNYLDNGVTPAVPFEHMTGAPANTQTSFAIQWTYSWRSDVVGSQDFPLYDSNYPYIVPYIIKVSGTTRSAFKLPLVPTELLGNITFTGNENYAISSVENIVLDKATYLTAKTITQLDNKLYLGNLTARKDIGFQRFAGNIRTIPVIKQIKRFDNRVYDKMNLNYGYTGIFKKYDGSYTQEFEDYRFNTNYYTKYQITSIYDGDAYFWTEDEDYPGTYDPATYTNRMGGYKNQYTASYLKSYRRGEVYALYISFVLNDGTETYAYHIPGRLSSELSAFYSSPEFHTSAITETGTSIDPYEPYLTMTEYDETNTARYSSLQNFDLKERLGNYHYNKVYDTGKEVIPDREKTDDEYSMGYWSNENETYPKTDDFKVFEVDSFGNAVDTENPLYTQEGMGYVRHHKFPSNLNPDFSFIEMDRTHLYRVVIPSGHVENNLLPNLRTVTSSWNDMVNQTSFFYETINILGFQLKNIRIPKFILKQVQGFKVYYAKRTLENKTILGQSLAHPSFFRNNGFFSYSKLSLTAKKQGPFSKYFSFYANIPDVVTEKQDSFIKYNTSFFGNFYYLADNNPEEDVSYLGSPVIKFHDFTMLRKKINVSTADYISIQSMVTMHQYNGMFRNAKQDTGSRENDNLEYVPGYLFFLTAQNTNEEFSWVSEDLNNLTTKVARKYIEGESNGTFRDLAPSRGPEFFKANLMVAARYNAYYQSNCYAYENSSDVFVNQFKPRALANVFTITNNGATYINGSSYLKITDADAFHGAEYLDNYAGESAIALALKSGLPRLLGYIPDNTTYNCASFDSISSSGSILSALNPEDENSSNTALQRGKGNIFLVNLHSYKTDVFNPFDNQQLVWTGYYHPMQVSEASLNTGAIGGVLNCIETLNYELVAEPTVPITTTVLGGSVILSYNTPPTDLGYPNLEFICTDENGDTLLPNTTYNYTLVLTNSVTNYMSDAYLQIGVGGDGLTIETSSGNTSFSGTYTTGELAEGEESLNLFFNLHDNGYKGTATLTITLDAPTCVDLYDSSILGFAFQNTPNYLTSLNTYADLNNYYTGFETGHIFGGDTFIARHTYRMTSMDFPNYYLVQNEVNDPTPIVGSLNTISPGFGDQMSLPEYISITTPTTDPLSPSNIYLGAVAFMNQRVLRTYGADSWPVINFSSFNLYTHFIALQYAYSGYISGQNPDSMYSLRNFFERQIPAAFTTLYSVFVESDDNLNFRHSGDVVKGVGKDKSLFFDGYNAAEIIFRSPLTDLTKQDNLLYEDHYSALQDIKTTVPFPKKGEIETAFPSRVIRSNVQDGRIDDNYRNFLALQYKDFSQNKGAITNLVALNGLLFIHTEKSLYKTTGKQNLQLGDSTEAYIGSGDIFAQEPMELVTAAEGHGGSFNKHSSIISKYGYTYVSRKEKKIFLLTDKLTEISQQGMENWFRLNIPYTLETVSEVNPYPVNLDTIPYLNLDAPTGSFGFVSTYDPLFKRFIITKRELIYSDKLKTIINQSFIPNGIDYTYDPEGCLETEYNTINNDTIPQGTGVGIINGSALLTKPYLAPTSAGIWYDPNLGAFIFNQALAEQFADLGIENWSQYTKEIVLQTTGETSIDCTTATFYLINISNDNYWFKENGWTISYYPDNQSWISRHSYVSPWYFYNSEYFFSFDSFVTNPVPDTFKIWKHNSTNGAQFYNVNYNYEFEFIVNDSPELTKVLSSVNFIADVYTKDETGSTALEQSVTMLKDKFNTYNIELPFKQFYIYNTYQNSGLVNFEYLNNIRKVEGSWMFNDFRDLVKYSKSNELSDNQYNISGAFNSNVQTPEKQLMFTDEGVINTNILDTTKPWYEQKKFVSKYFGVRLIGQGNNNLVNLYSANATLRKSSR